MPVFDGSDVIEYTGKICLNDDGILAGIQAAPVLKYIQSIHTFQHVFISKRHFAISVFLITFRKISMLLFPIDLAERF